MVLGVVSVSCGIDRVLPVLRPVCDAFVSSRMHVCVCVCGRRAACMRLKPNPVYCINLNGT